MQSLKISSLIDDGLQVLVNTILEMKHYNNFNINSTLTNLGHTSIFSGPQWKWKHFVIGIPIVAISIIALSIGLYCKCFWNRKSCVCRYTRPTSLPVNDTYIDLQPISNPLPDISDQLSPYIIHEVLKASCVRFFEIQTL